MESGIGRGEGPTARPARSLGGRQAVAGDPVVMASILKAPNVTLLPGGIPLMSGETVIGAIGASGGSGEQDVEVSQAGVAALGA